MCYKKLELCSFVDDADLPLDVVDVVGVDVVLTVVVLNTVTDVITIILEDRIFSCIQK